MNTNLSENIYNTIDLLIEKRLNAISFDTTIICEIVNDSNAEKGEYIVKGNNLTFKAYSMVDTRFSKLSKVYVMIPQGDYNLKKIILGEAKEDVIGVSKALRPLDSITPIGSTNWLKGVTLKEGDKYQVKNFYLDTTLNAKKYFGIKAIFTTNMSVDTVSGRYGLKLYKNEEINTPYAYFTSDELSGDPYRYEGGFTVEKLFPMPDDMTSLTIEFFNDIENETVDMSDLTLVTGIGEVFDDNANAITEPILNLYLSRDQKQDFVMTKEEEGNTETRLIQALFLENNVGYWGEDFQLPGNYQIKWYIYREGAAAISDLAGPGWIEIVAEDRFKNDNFILEYPLNTATSKEYRIKAMIIDGDNLIAEDMMIFSPLPNEDLKPEETIYTNLLEITVNGESHNGNFNIFGSDDEFRGDVSEFVLGFKLKDGATDITSVKWTYPLLSEDEKQNSFVSFEPDGNGLKVILNTNKKRTATFGSGVTVECSVGAGNDTYSGSKTLTFGYVIAQGSDYSINAIDVQGYDAQDNKIEGHNTFTFTSQVEKIKFKPVITNKEGSLIETKDISVFWEQSYEGEFEWKIPEYKISIAKARIPDETFDQIFEQTIVNTNMIGYWMRKPGDTGIMYYWSEPGGASTGEIINPGQGFNIVEIEYHETSYQYYGKVENKGYVKIGNNYTGYFGAVVTERDGSYYYEDNTITANTNTTDSEFFRNFPGAIEVGYCWAISQGENMPAINIEKDLSFKNYAVQEDGQWKVAEIDLFLIPQSVGIKATEEKVFKEGEEPQEALSPKKLIHLSKQDSDNFYTLTLKSQSDIRDFAILNLQAKQFTLSNGLSINLSVSIPIAITTLESVPNVIGPLSILYKQIGGYEVSDQSYSLGSEDTEWSLGQLKGDSLPYKINSKNKLEITDIYKPNTLVNIIASQTGGAIWCAPLLIRQEAYGSQTLNNWNGELLTDSDNNTILSSLLGAGKKEDDNTFTGVFMGTVGKEIKNAHTGLYGFKNGVKCFELNELGEFYVGDGNSYLQLVDGVFSIKANLEIDSQFLKIKNNYFKALDAQGNEIFSVEGSRVKMAGWDITKDRMSYTYVDNNKNNHVFTINPTVTSGTVLSVNNGAFRINADGTFYTKSNVGTISSTKIVLGATGAFQIDEQGTLTVGRWTILSDNTSQEIKLPNSKFSIGVSDALVYLNTSNEYHSYCLVIGGNGISYYYQDYNRENSWVYASRSWTELLEDQGIVT